MSQKNMHTVEMQVVRKGQKVTVEITADVEGDVVAVDHATSDGKPFLMDDNEYGAARCAVLDKLAPKQGWDKRRDNLLRIAAKWPGI